MVGLVDGATTPVTPPGKTAAAAVEAARRTAVVRLFDPARWLRPEFASKINALARDPLAGCISGGPRTWIR